MEESRVARLEKVCVDLKAVVTKLAKPKKRKTAARRAPTKKRTTKRKTAARRAPAKKRTKKGPASEKAIAKIAPLLVKPGKRPRPELGGELAFPGLSTKSKRR